MQNLVGEKRVGELPEEGFQKHRGNVNILIGEWRWRLVIRLVIEDKKDLDLKVHIFSLVNLRLQLPHNCRIGWTPAMDF